MKNNEDKKKTEEKAENLLHILIKSLFLLVPKIKVIKKTKDGRYTL